MIYYTSSRAVLYLTTLFVLRPTRTRLIGKDASLTQSSPTPPRVGATAFSPSPSSPSTPPRRGARYTLRWDAHHTSDSEIWRRREPVAAATTMTRRRRTDPDTRWMRGRERGGEQATTRSRDLSAPAVRRTVANLGFEFIVCRFKNVSYNSVNAFYQLGNNCKINNNSVIT
jgi:hypothetical protein